MLFHTHVVFLLGLGGRGLLQVSQGMPRLASVTVANGSHLETAPHFAHRYCAMQSPASQTCISTRGRALLGFGGGAASGKRSAVMLAAR